MMKKLKYVIATSLLFGLSGVNSAKAITADELLVGIQSAIGQVNQIFTQIGQALVNHESRISNLENENPNLGGYSMGFSADGSPKNVVVLTRVEGNGDTLYFVRSRYASGTEQISINGVLTQRSFIANYGFARTDSLGNLIAASNYIEAPDTEDYIIYNVEESFYDPPSFNTKTVTSDTLREDWSMCKYGQTTICVPDVSDVSIGDHVNYYNWSSIRGLSDPVTLTFNGLTFNDVRLEQMITSNFARVRAKGIGEILRTANDGSWENKAIFYRANGVSTGSLAGTPFDAGQLLDGLFF